MTIHESDAAFWIVKAAPNVLTNARMELLTKQMLMKSFPVRGYIPNILFKAGAYHHQLRLPGLRPDQIIDIWKRFTASPFYTGNRLVRSDPRSFIS